MMVTAGLAGALLLTACNRQPKAAGPPPTPEVVTLTVTQQTVRLTTELPGRTAPYLMAEIRPQVSGLILKRQFVEGSEVKAGQVLYQIDPAPFQAALDNARAALGRVEANLPALRARAARFKELLAARAVSQQSYDDAVAALNQAEADLQFYKAAMETARINLNYAQVVSPISGRIGVSSVTDGAIVTAYQPVPLATVQQLDPIYVNVPQSATDLLRLQQRLKAGQLKRDSALRSKVQLILPDGSGYAHEGTLRMVFPNPDGVLLPGMFVRGVVLEGVNEQAILVPQQAVSRDSKGNPFVLLVNAENKVEQRPLTLERTLADQWLVSKGLEPGDKVIVEGIQKARPGAVVKVVVPGEGGKPAASAPAGTTPAAPANSK
jgi:membrane fusion protein (multidrug efflux system)